MVSVILNIPCDACDKESNLTKSDYFASCFLSLIFNMDDFVRNQSRPARPTSVFTCQFAPAHEKKTSSSGYERDSIDIEKEFGMEV